MRIRTAAALSAALATTASAAYAADPVGGGHYVGTTEVGGRVSVRVNDTGSAIPKNGFAAHLKSTCSDGERVSGSVVSFRIRIRGDGSFVQQRSGGLRSERQGEPDAGSYTFRITGRFGPRRVLKGTIQSKTRTNDGVVCRSGRVSYSARLR